MEKEKFKRYGILHQSILDIDELWVHGKRRNRENNLQASFGGLIGL